MQTDIEAEKPLTEGELVLVSGEVEPRVSDTALAERLGFSRSRDIRKIITRNRIELETYGDLIEQDEARHGGAPRATAKRVFLLNEGQALVVCVLSQAPFAPAVRQAVVQTYMSLRRSRAQISVQQSILPMQSHRRRNRVRAAKLRLAEAVSALDVLGVDVQQIDINSVLSFARSFLR